MKNPLCKYRHIFGVEGEGAHKYRVFNIAVVDTVLTIIGAWLIAKLLKANFWIVLIIVFVVGTLLHRLFCVKTTLTKMVFGENW